MAEANIVDFLLSVRDDVSPVLRSLQAQFKATEGATKSTRSAWDDFLQGVTVGVGFKALDTLLDKIGSLKDAFWDAAQAQTQMIASSSDIGTNLGIGIGAAKDVVKGLQVSIANMAGALPGVTKDYNDVFLAIGGTMSKLYAGDTEGFKKATTDITERAGVLAAIRQVNGEAAGSALNRLLAGTMGFGEARQLDLFQKNPALQGYITQTAQQKNLDISKIQQWSMKERYEVISAALKLATPDTLINEFKGTAESIVQTWQTNLFDPIVGLFGVSRQVASRANRTALDAFTGLLQQLDIFSQAFGGLGFDPMAGLIDFLDWLSVGVAKLTSLKQQGANFFNSFLDGIASFDIKQLLPFILQGVVNMGNNLLKFIDSIDWSKLGFIVGKGLADMVALIREFLLSPDTWANALKTFAAIMTSVLEFLGGAVKGVFTSFTEQLSGFFTALKDFFSDPIGFATRILAPQVNKAPDTTGSIFSDKPAISLPDVKTDQQKQTNFLFQPSVSVTTNSPDSADTIAGKVVEHIDNKFQEYTRQWAF